VNGTIFGNVVVNGTLGVQAGGVLSIDGFSAATSSGNGAGDPFGAAQTISGSGTLVLSEGSQLDIGVADSAAIQFAGPSGQLGLAVLPTGKISGFAAGDTIELYNSLATGLSYTQTSASVATLKLTKGGKAAGSLTLAGSYTGSSLFHLSFDAYGDEFISLQTIGSAPVQPSAITGTVGTDDLRATANNQTLTGLGGGDTLDGNGFAGTIFKDTSADLNGSTITNFVITDVIDLTDMAPGTATVSFTPGSYNATTNTTVPGSLTVTDGTHTATMTVASASAFPVGYVGTSADGKGGTNVKYVAVNIDAYAFSAALGGGYSVAANWQDATTKSAATGAPSYGNAVTIVGGTSYTDVTGNGVAASLATSGAVLLWALSSAAR
jgi:hypothetical protein